MEFYGNAEEYLMVSELSALDTKTIKDNNCNALTIFWNTKADTTILIDNVSYVLKTNEMVFLTEFHNVSLMPSNDLKVIQFNRYFYCIDNHDSEIGCKGILFFGASQVPIIKLNEENNRKFEVLWGVFITELNSKDALQIDMLQMLLKRFLILATRIYKEENRLLHMDNSQVDVIRNFSFLVEVHYKNKHSVSEYANLLNKPAKSLTNLFANHIDKSPLQIIQNRILLEAKRKLLNSDLSIKETAFELGFEDLQSFSRFFKNKQGISPKMFRENKIEVV